jgi:2-oxoglutarate ferredoxin oxidoreductase subunit beta
MIHILRRNFNVNILLFNNEIYGLTKGQYSPTSQEGTVTKSTPIGSIDHPFNPIALCMGADATFLARTMDRDPKHQQAILKMANDHKGASFVEIYQNCNVFNDGAFEVFTEKSSKKNESIFMENGKPLIFGDTNNKGIKLDGFTPVIVDVAERSANDLWIHNERDRVKAGILSRFFDNPKNPNHLPRPFGVFYVEDRPCYEDRMAAQIKDVISSKGVGNLDKLLSGRETWVVN